MNPEYQSALNWLLTDEHAEIRAAVLTDLLDGAEKDTKVCTEWQNAHTSGVIAKLLQCMHPEGYWGAPGAGYAGKYRSSVWVLITLAQIGAHRAYDERIDTACQYILSHAFCQGGQFSTNGAPFRTVDCLQGNLCWALTKLGCQDERLKTAFDWMARCVTGEGISSSSDKKASRRFYAGKCGPTFACGANDSLPCAWGAAKVLLALSNIPQDFQSSQTQQAIQAGVNFFLSENPATAPWPNGWSEKPSRNWWLFGFPVFYVTDLLQVAEALCALGYGTDQRVLPLIELIQSKQETNGYWRLEYDYSGKMDVDFGKKGEPSPWVTLRALRVLKKSGAG